MIVRPPQNPEEFERYRDLRWRILRAPWNQPRGSELDEIEAKEIVKLFYDPRKRMEICLTHYFDDKNKAVEIVDSIFDKRVYIEKKVLKRKIQRIPVTINNGPISESAQHTLQTPENTEDDQTD